MIRCQHCFQDKCVPWLFFFFNGYFANTAIKGKLSPIWPLYGKLVQIFCKLSSDKCYIKNGYNKLRKLTSFQPTICTNCGRQRNAVHLGWDRLDDSPRGTTYWDLRIMSPRSIPATVGFPKQLSDRSIGKK